MYENKRQMKYQTAMLEGQTKMLQMLAYNEPLANILEEIIYAVQEKMPTITAGIFALNRTEQTLQHGVGPNLPTDYIETINNQAIYVGENETFDGDALSKKLENLSKKYGYNASCSLPIYSPGNELVGAFLLHSIDCDLLTEVEETIESYIRLTGLAIDYKQSEFDRDYYRHVNTVTTLPNATQFKKQLQQSVHQMQQTDSKLAVLFIDLDRFNIVNNLGGYTFGDKVLKDVAKRLTQCVSDDESKLYSWNSDKFLCIVPNVTKEKMNTITTKMTEQLSTPFKKEHLEFVLTSSMGISLFPDNGHDVESLTKNAEAAMNAAKIQGKNIIKYYTPSINSELNDQLMMEKELRKALKANELLIYYQPQIDLTTNQIIGLEGLLRWDHPTMGFIPPTKFIKLAEETGLIIPIGEWVLHCACQQMKQLISEGFPPLRLSINLSSVQFHQQNLIESVQDAIKQSGLPSNSLVLEVTESTLVEDMEFTVKQLQELKDLGIQIALDDFGTLYSSLNYLKHFPLDTVKIDRSFVRNIVTDEKDLEIVKTIIQLAKNLKLKVLAEGIETQEQRTKLQESKCGEGQGYLFSRPVPIEELKALMKNHGVKPFV